jgi:hypothetical protein
METHLRFSRHVTFDQLTTHRIAHPTTLYSLLLYWFQRTPVLVVRVRRTEFMDGNRAAPKPARVGRARRNGQERSICEFQLVPCQGLLQNDANF